MTRPNLSVCLSVCCVSNASEPTSLLYFFCFLFDWSSICALISLLVDALVGSLFDELLN